MPPSPECCRRKTCSTRTNFSVAPRIEHNRRRRERPGKRPFEPPCLAATCPRERTCPDPSRAGCRGEVHRCHTSKATPGPKWCRHRSVAPRRIQRPALGAQDEVSLEGVAARFGADLAVMIELDGPTPRAGACLRPSSPPVGVTVPEVCTIAPFVTVRLTTTSSQRRAVDARERKLVGCPARESERASRVRDNNRTWSALNRSVPAHNT